MQIKVIQMKNDHQSKALHPFAAPIYAKQQEKVCLFLHRFSSSDNPAAAA